jgi:hypothetical protein
MMLINEAKAARSPRPVRADGADRTAGFWFRLWAGFASRAFRKALLRSLAPWGI